VNSAAGTGEAGEHGEKGERHVELSVPLHQSLMPDRRDWNNLGLRVLFAPVLEVLYTTNFHHQLYLETTLLPAERGTSSLSCVLWYYLKTKCTNRQLSCMSNDKTGFLKSFFFFFLFKK